MAHMPVAFTAVELTDRLWAPRQRAVRERTVPFLYAQMEKIGTIEALDVTKPPGPLAFPYRKNNTSTSVMYWDSDIAKWIETASYTIATHPDPALEGLIDDVVARIAKAQEPDGYFNSFFQRREPTKKWTNLRDWHELYCLGHMIEAAVAHNQATGKTNLLDIVLRQVDLVARLFGPNEGQRRGYCGHEEIELALVKLHRLTGERRHLELARYFIDERGRQPHYFDIEARARSADPADYWHRPTNTIRATCRCASRTASWDMPCAPCISIAPWPIWRRRPAMPRCSRRAGACGPTSTTSGSMSPAASGPPSTTRGSPPTTTCPTRRHTPRPAPRSAWCSGRTVWRCSKATAAMPTSWSRRSTTTR